MRDIELSERIAAPIDTVWEVFTDLAGAADHIRGIDSIELLTSGPMQLGTRWRETRTMYGREATEEMEVTAFEPPERYVVEAESHGANYRSEYRFRADGGATEVATTFAATPTGLFGRIMGVVMGRAMAKSVASALEDDLRDLKRVAEAGA